MAGDLLRRQQGTCGNHGREPAEKTAGTCGNHSRGHAITEKQQVFN